MAAAPGGGAGDAACRSRTDGHHDRHRVPRDRRDCQGTHPVRSLTTAASIWIAAAIGVVIGMGFYPAAGLGVALSVGVLAVFRRVEAVMPAPRDGRPVTPRRAPEPAVLRPTGGDHQVARHLVRQPLVAFAARAARRLRDGHPNHHFGNLRHLAKHGARWLRSARSSILPAGDHPAGRAVPSRAASAAKRSGVPTSHHRPS